MKPYEKYWQILQTIPGVDALSAAVIIAEVGVDMKHFASEEKFCSWAGMCPGNNESAGKRKSSHITKEHRHCVRFYVKSPMLQVELLASSKAIIKVLR